jgi:TOBE domain
VDAVERLGEASLVYMRLAGGEDVIVRVAGDDPAVPGDLFTAQVPHRALHVFDGAGHAVRMRAGRR